MARYDRSINHRPPGEIKKRQRVSGNPGAGDPDGGKISLPLPHYHAEIEENNHFIPISWGNTNKISLSCGIQDEINEDYMNRKKPRIKQVIMSIPHEGDVDAH